MRITRNFILTIILTVIAGASLLINWLQYEQNTQLNSSPNIVACLRSLSYEKGHTFPNGGFPNYQPTGTISFTLVNKGTNAATVTRVDVSPVGTEKDGTQGWMWFTIDADETVPGNGVAQVVNKTFTNINYVQGNNWIEKPSSVLMDVYWPSGEGTRLECLPNLVLLNQTWFCGPPVPPSASLAEENACR